MKVIDVSGRVIEMKSGILPNSTIQLGSEIFPWYLYSGNCSGKGKGRG